MVYGESRDRNNKLREFKDGKLKLGPGDLIPVRFFFLFYFLKTEYFHYFCYYHSCNGFYLKGESVKQNAYLLASE